MALKPYGIFNLVWNDVAQAVRTIIPPLTHLDHKGAMGRVGVLGGSRDYTGAPFYAASASLKFGADLAFVFCSEQASIPIKCYSPELMVTPIYRDFALEDPATRAAEVSRSAALVKSFLPRLSTLVLGPGLGRGEGVADLAAAVLAAARERNLLTVIDADGLWVVTQRPTLVSGLRNCILTPNAAEFERLVEAARALDPEGEGLRSANAEERARALAVALGVTVLRKGAADVVTAGGDVFALTHPTGSPRRCGGQGDLLAGALAVALGWASAGEAARGGVCLQAGAHDAPPTVLAALLASAALRTASVAAFQRSGRGATSLEVLAALPAAFAEVADERFDC